MILPDGKNTTPLGNVIRMTESGNVLVLKRFVPDYDFLVEKLGGDRSYLRGPTRGPDLTHVMDWYWGSATEENAVSTKKVAWI